jgi:hypothetical protein
LFENKKKRSGTSPANCYVLFEEPHKIVVSQHWIKIGRKDHATVLHACKTVTNLMDTDKQFRLDVEEIEKRLKV